jgi:hypothetical protein
MNNPVTFVGDVSLMNIMGWGHASDRWPVIFVGKPTNILAPEATRS